jgi:hypothetical protein
MDAIEEMIAYSNQGQTKTESLLKKMQSSAEHLLNLKNGCWAPDSNILLTY